MISFFKNDSCVVVHVCLKKKYEAICIEILKMDISGWQERKQPFYFIFLYFCLNSIIVL